MILVDMNQVTISNLMMQVGSKRQNDVDENLVRHMVLNSLRMYRSRFFEEFGELILCYDNKRYWRRDYFPNYKCNRRKDRANSNLDWNLIFETLNTIRDEIVENFPYKVIEVDGAEADDCIATICMHINQTPNEYEKVLILSSDKDFIQLQKYLNVKQYSPILKKYVEGHNPDTYIKEHILKGDTSDGIPNVLSPDNTFVDGLRQKPLGKKKIDAWLNMNINDLHDEVKRNYQRNVKLIDLSKIPNELESEIIKEFHSAPFGDRGKLLNYFIKSRLKNLTETIGEF